MQLGAKLFIAVLFLFAISPVFSREVHVLVLEDLLSSENNVMMKCKELDANHMPRVKIGLNDVETKNFVNINGSSCEQKKFLLHLGEKMIRAGMAERVDFTSIGTQGKTINKWSVNGIAYQDFKSAIKFSNAEKIHFEYVLWTGKFIDTDFFVENYQETINKDLKIVKLNSKTKKFIISPSVKCGNVDKKNKVVYRWDGIFNRFPGPDLNSIGNDYFSEKCHINELGVEKLAELWLKSMQKADIKSENYQKESLLYYFK